MRKHIELIGTIAGLCIMCAGPYMIRQQGAPRSMGIACSVAGGAIFGVSVAMQFMKKIMTDKKVAREINDERNRLIQQRAGAVTSSISFALLITAAVMFIAMEYYVPAVVIGVFYFIQLFAYLIILVRMEKAL